MTNIEKLKDDIRNTLEEEIKSYCKSVELLAKHGKYDEAAKRAHMREGLSWALFVLAQKHGI